ncbi:MAG TPA: hypothetical protein VFJ58_01290, partial [Armatimonadota bacterium]|nr:hypothetical protein [Armatimonadota bacterium]
HRTIYPESQRPVQTNLFGDALLDLNRDLPCKLVGVSAPPTGTRVSVHVNPAGTLDVLWGNLTENPAMGYVAREFQTGLRGPRAANRAIDDLSELQERLGRPLHPVTLGAGRYAPLLKNHFDGFTILDSRPFMLAARRRRLIQSGHGNYSEVSSPTDPNETIDALLQRNVRERAERFRGKSRADDQPPSPML